MTPAPNGKKQQAPAGTRKAGTNKGKPTVAGMRILPKEERIRLGRTISRKSTYSFAQAVTSHSNRMEVSDSTGVGNTSEGLSARRKTQGKQIVTATSAREDNNTEWQLARGKSSRRKRASKKINALSEAEYIAPRPRPKASATAAIIINCEGSKTTYTDAMKTVMGKIHLQDMGISKTHVRKGRTGCFIIEILKAEDGDRKAATLAEKMKETLLPHIKVSCPKRMAAIRISGFDESVSDTDIKAKLLEINANSLK